MINVQRVVYPHVGINVVMLVHHHVLKYVLDVQLNAIQVAKQNVKIVMDIPALNPDLKQLNIS
jgi:hypothetical protein